MTEAQAEKEATRQAFLFEEEIRRGEVLDQSTKMEDFLVKWLHNYAEKQLRATTLTGYKSMLPRINAAFGKMKLADIRPTHLLAFYDNLSDAGVRGDEYFTATELVGELAAERFATRKAFFTAAGISKRTSQSMFAGGKVTGDTAERVCAVLGSGFRRAVHRRRGRDALREYDTALPPLIVRDIQHCGQLAGHLLEPLRAREAPENAP